jgi:uncharacterized protein YkwD
MQRFIRVLIGLLCGIIILFLTESTIGGKKITTSIREFSPTMEQQTRQLVQRIMPSPKPTPTPLTETAVVDIINQKRQENQAPLLKEGKQTCAVLNMYMSNQQLTAKQVHEACPSCNNLYIMTFAKPVTEVSFLGSVIQDASSSAVLTNKKLQYECVKQNTESMYVATVEAGATVTTSTTTTSPKEISEDELWQALAEYRRDHKVPDLSKDEKLCVYARKRLNDHINMWNEHKAADTYPVPAKYPLDAHEGFKKDADSGYVFETTGRSTIAENLAYWPTATYGVHVIEWGWDTSTEGHRETQLSTEYTLGCLTGHLGFYVAIFAK